MDFGSIPLAHDSAVLSKIQVPMDSPLGIAILVGIGLIVLFVLVLVVVGMRGTFGGMAANRQLQAGGAPAMGRIVAVRDVGGSIRMSGRMPDHRLQIDLEVDLQNGQPIYRTSVVQFVSMLHVGRLQPGAVIPVRYDTTNPMRVALVL